MKRTIGFFIGDIIENMRLAERIAAEIDFQTFESTEEKHYTVVRCIEIIGEAVKNVPLEVRQKYPGIPWKALAGMRDLAIHFYMGIDYNPHSSPFASQILNNYWNAFTQRINKNISG
jgi:uncharacterized protein with HEPN domain